LKKKIKWDQEFDGIAVSDSARTVILWHLSEYKLFYHHFYYDLFSSLGEKRMNM